MKRSIIDKEKNIETALVLVLACIVLSYLSKKPIFLIIGMVLGIIGLFIPVLATWITWLWYKLSEGLGFVTSKILLSVVFFLILTPIATLKKLMEKKGIAPNPKSNYVERNHTYLKKDLENPW